MYDETNAEYFEEPDYYHMGCESDDPENDWEYACVNCGCDTRDNHNHNCSN